MGKRKVKIEDLLAGRENLPYEEQVHYVHALLDSGKITPLQRAKTNGRRPALALSYWEMTEDRDYSDLKDELLYDTVPEIRVDYYLRNLSTYEKERDDVRLLSAFFKDHRQELSRPVSVNERSFMIFHREKFLSQGGGKTLLSHCGLEIGALNTVQTAEPFSYYAGSRVMPQNLLILENKDPFCGMRSHLLAGQNTILGKTIDTLIYGAGKKAVASLSDFSISAEPYMKDPGNHFYYFGDLDYEGIGIYEHLRERFLSLYGIEILPFEEAYLAMLQKGQGILLPKTKEGQNRNVSGAFFSYFDTESVQRMEQILSDGCYIPQEILNEADY